MFNELRRASYQGIPFEVSGSELNFGYRTVTHINIINYQKISSKKY